MGERRKLEELLRTSEQTIQDLKTKLDEDEREASELALLNQRLAEELEDQKNQHQKDLEDSDFAGDQTRKKYQGVFAFTLAPFLVTNRVQSRTCSTQ